MKILVTGAAGFIGHQTTLKLLARGETVIGVDNLNDYYDVSLKEARLQDIAKHPQASNFKFIKLDLADTSATEDLFKAEQPQRVIHLAAQAGVRYSLQNPNAYVQSNLVAFTNILEGCRHNKVEHLVYASSSSVYGGNTKLPFSEQDTVDQPVSLYAATKKANELMAHTYSHLYGIPTTGLRFFTVYGPWGRPDMSPFLFADAILNNKPIKVFNHGDMMRDFTYIDDIVEGVVRVADKPARPQVNSSVPYRVFNIGNNQPEKLMDFIGILENAFGKLAEKEFLPMQAGDVKATYADTSALETWVGFKPYTPLKDGIAKFADWYKAYYNKS
ncbi:MAG: NAD-dependent epimerase [Burkholderiaceae bacterium]|nr:NAD-dependent epimerase [Burkholderiaceae bacterium]